MSAKATTRIREVDKGANKLLKAARDFGGKVLRVGIVGGAGEEEHSPGVTVGDIAGFHEFGDGNNPERSWLRAWFDGDQSNIKQDVRKVTRLVLEGRMDEQQALDILGAKFVGEIQKRIADGIAPPLLEATVRRKVAMGTGGATPLIATGQFRGSISWEVEG